VRQTRADEERVDFSVELINVGHHPPRFTVHNGVLEVISARETIQTTTMRISTTELLRWRPGTPPVGVIDMRESEQYVTVTSNAMLANAWRALPDVLGRIVVQMPRARAQLPWEDLLFPTDLDRVPVVREIWPDAGRNERLLGPSIDVAVSAAPPLPAPSPDSLFDRFVQAAAEDGHIRWGATVDEADLRHLVVNDSEAAASLIQGVVSPRMVVIHVAQERVPMGGIDAIDMAFSAGAWAVLIAAIDQLQGRRFFTSFYRKLFHNWPLEYCVLAGLRGISDSWTSHSELPHAVRLFTRPGGEVALSPPRIAAEVTVTPLSALTTKTAAVPSAALNLRSRRAGADVRRRAEVTARELAVEKFGDQIDGLNDLAFGVEARDFRDITQVAWEVREQSQAEAAVIADVETSPPGPRQLNVTFRDGLSGDRVSTDVALRPQARYLLDVAVEPTADDAHVSVVFDESSLAEAFRKRDTVDLHVVVFAPPDQFEVIDNIQVLHLPRVGASQPVTFEIRPQRAGWCGLRVAVYSHNALVQSLSVQAYVSADPAPATALPTIRRQLDWVASTDLQLLEELPTPAFTIFSNDGPDGSHWIGVFSQDSQGRTPLISGQMRAFDNLDLTARIRDLRRCMQAVHGVDSYSYPRRDSVAHSDVVAFGEAALVTLAKTGYVIYDHLFESADDLARDRLDAFVSALATMDDGRPNIVSVARCDAKWTLPWAGLYDKYLDVDRHQELKLCGVFKQQMLANRWDDGQLVEITDLLDDPAACHAQADCPLRSAEAEITVCPFGFWGFRYQIEQPLQEVQPTGDDQVPEELRGAVFSQTSMIRKPAGTPVRIGVGAFPFPGISEHEEEMKALQDASQSDVKLEWKSDRPDVMELLYHNQGHHVFYFHCHGVEGEDGFALQVGPQHDPQNMISAASINRQRVRWAIGDNAQPLVLLVACESAAMRPELAHGLFGKFRRINAAGVVGSEITIGVRLGRECGRSLVAAIVAGKSAGEAFVDLRRDLLRRFNPLGLALTVYAPATLHICDDPDGGGACRRHHASRSGAADG
jgi:hypothetical protein